MGADIRGLALWLLSCDTSVPDRWKDPPDWPTLSMIPEQRLNALSKSWSSTR